MTIDDCRKRVTVWHAAAAAAAAAVIAR